jgi:phosphosulfolactate synthase (CoM biosynthesis protein A)
MGEKKAFEFMKLPKLQSKPRKKGIVEIRGPYYTSITFDWLRGLLHDWSDWFDGYKFAAGSFRLLDASTLKSIINLCHDHDVYVSTGGAVERYIIEGPEMVDRYFEECKRFDFDVIELSSGFADIPTPDMIEMVKRVRELGMKPKPEISFMYEAGGGTHEADYRVRYKPTGRIMDEIRQLVRSGVELMMFESEGITEDLPVEKWRKDLIMKVVKEFGFERFMFEASDPPVFKWYYKQFGRDVNLFVDHSQLVEYNIWRLGLWGDADIWNGRKASYKGAAKR